MLNATRDWYYLFQFESEVEESMKTDYKGFIIISYREEVSRKGTTYLLKVSSAELFVLCNENTSIFFRTIWYP